jgi:hypothetical protein
MKTRAASDPCRRAAERCQFEKSRRAATWVRAVLVRAVLLLVGSSGARSSSVCASLEADCRFEPCRREGPRRFEQGQFHPCGCVLGSSRVGALLRDGSRSVGARCTVGSSRFGTSGEVGLSGTG